MPHEDNSTTQNTTSSQDDPAMDLSSLANEVGRLSETANWWSSWGMWVVVAAAVIALIAAGFQTMGVRRATALANAQQRLGEAKETQLTKELKDKDLRIAEAKAVAGAANERAAKANESAAKAHEGLAKAHLDIEERKNENLKLELAVNSEKKELETLQKKLSIRRINASLFDWKKLMLLRDVEVDVTVGPDSDAAYCAYQLMSILMFTGALADVKKSDNPLGEGISIVVATVGDVPVERQRNLGEIAVALAEGLRNNGFKAGSGGSGRGTGPQSAKLEITIGHDDLLTAGKLQLGPPGASKVIDPLEGFDITDIPSEFTSRRRAAEQKKRDAATDASK
jgi:hypothetical protein